MALWQESSDMCLCVFLLFTGIQRSTGCSSEASHLISCSPGESVLLSCLNTQSHYEGIQWWYSRTDVNDPEYQLSPDCSKERCYTNRFHIHRNLSLSITNLIVEDTGKYWCKSSEADNNNKYIALTIEGCSISVNETSAVKVSRYSRESVLLSCFVQCSARHKPDQWGWKLPNDREMTSTELNSLHERRLQMFNNTSGNFSLLISDLTEADEGLYSCWINKNQHKNFILNVNGKSVLLSCSCEDDLTKPKHFEWRRADLNKSVVSDTERSKGRFMTFVHDSPANLSLLMSNLTESESDQQSRVINLTVTGSKGPIMIILIGLMMLMVLGTALCIYWRYMTAKKISSRKSQRADHEDDAANSTVMQIKGRKPSGDQQQNDITYAEVTLNKRPKLQEEQTTTCEDDVIYSSVAHSKSLHMSTADTTLYTSV